MPLSPPRKVHQPAGQRPHEQPDPSCPFCSIASTFAPISPLEPDDSTAFDPAKLFPATFIVLSTPDVVAFLDIAPLTRGHILVATRRHRVKMGDLASREGAEIGRLLPLLARSVLRAILPDMPVSDADYNIVQNNGAGAAQVIPHVHFHIIPRPPLDTTPQKQRAQKSWTMFGRGRREELDEDDAALLAPRIRANVRDEVERERREAREKNAQEKMEKKKTKKKKKNEEEGERVGVDLLATVWGEESERGDEEDRDDGQGNQTRKERKRRRREKL